MCANLCSQATVGAHSAEGEQGLLEGRGQLPATPQTTRDQQTVTTHHLICVATKTLSVALTTEWFRIGLGLPVRELSAAALPCPRCKIQCNKNVSSIDRWSLARRQYMSNNSTLWLTVFATHILELYINLIKGTFRVKNKRETQYPIDHIHKMWDY